MRAVEVRMYVTMDNGRITEDKVPVSVLETVADVAAILAERAENLLHHVNIGCPLPVPHDGRQCTTGGS